MRQIFRRRFIHFLGFLLAAAPLAASGQSHDAAPATGWGSNWTEPANEQQRQRREFVHQAETLAKAHDYKGMLELCNRAIQKEPNGSGLFLARAIAYSELKQHDRALADMDHAQELVQKKNLPEASARLLIARASLDGRRRDYPAAINDLQASLKLNDKNPVAWNDLAWLRATSPDDSIRNGAESVREAQKAIALEGSERSCWGTDTLAAAYAEANDYPRAIEFGKRALSLAGTQIKDAARAKKFQEKVAERLRLYEQHQPFRTDFPTES